MSPHIRSFLIIGSENFEGVYPAFNDDEITYQARIKEAVEGNLNIGNPYIKEHMSDPFIMPPVGEWIIAIGAWITNTSVPFMTSASDFVFGFVDFVLVYALFLMVTRKRKWVALFYTVLFISFSLSTFGRPISPQLNSIFLYLGIIATARIYFLDGVSKKSWNRTAGLIAGITCFISPYFFTALLVFYFALFLLKGVFEKSIEPLKRNIPSFLITFIPFALLYAFFQIRAAGDPSYSETVLRYGLFQSHLPGSYTNVAFGVLTLGVIFIAYKFLTQRAFIFGLSVVSSIWILNLQNIITGKSLQFSSHYLFTTILFVLMALAVIHGALLEQKGKTSNRKTMAIIGIIFVVSLVAYNQRNEFMHIANMPYTREELIEEQRKMKVFEWLNENTEPNSVVYSLGDNYDFLIPIYTENKVYYNFYAALYPASNTETEERWLIQNMFVPEIDSNTIRDRQREFWGNRFIDVYQSAENRKKIVAFLTRTKYAPSEMIDESFIDYMHTRWEGIKEQPHEELFGRYQIDYILLSKEYLYFNDTKKRLDETKNITLQTTMNGELIYSVVDPL
ncbi:MAG: hypothetical protein K9M10_00560 [Candidatus Pacebacteria bacterium]|nr:hypothetical protein [Candidatus Paceibacterota bacterium]MCF7856954.1 hypothetical protein [Candidatus Paceibacterota bacterium]